MEKQTEPNAGGGKKEEEKNKIIRTSRMEWHWKPLPTVEHVIDGEYLFSFPYTVESTV